MAPRAKLVDRIARLVGEDVVRISDAGVGWPALGSLCVDGHWVDVALYVGPVGLSHRERDELERRFQNPGGNRPIEKHRGRHLLLLGLWEHDELLSLDQPLLVSADPIHRLNRATRFSVFVSTNTLRLALHTGWAEDPNATGETIRCFAPALLPTSYSADLYGASPDADAMRAVIDGSGLLARIQPDSGAAERARRASSTLVRDARFSRRVVAAYGGLCAMCGLNSDLVEAAHIYPVAAPRSSDEPWNGVALCPNHHATFDRHLVAVNPVTSEIVFANSIEEGVATSTALRSLVDGTFRCLAAPQASALRPRAEMFEKRYQFFDPRYAWVPSG